MKLAVKKDQPLRTASGKELNVTWLNPTNKKAQGVIRRYEHSSADDIYKAYGRPSDRKVSSFYLIKGEMATVKGFDIRIIGAGSDVYSCAYQVKDGSGVTYLVYHTPDNRYAIEYKIPDWMEATRL